MADLHDQNPIDQLFKKSFDSQSEAPDLNGWDKPSARVWENIQSEIAPKSVSFQKYLWAGLGLVGVSLLAFLFMNKKTNANLPTTPSNPAAIQTPTIATPNVQNTVANPAIKVENSTEKEIVRQPTKSKKPKTSKTRPDKEVLPEVEPKVNSTKPFVPNSTVRDQQKKVDDN
jgi:hypothetical protein